jgi:hypothetical protein
MPLADRFIRFLMVAAVIMVAGVSFEISFNDIRSLVLSFGAQSNFIATIFPLCLDGMLGASNLTLLYCSRYDLNPPRLARFTLWAGILATLAANVTHGLEYNLGAGLVGAWPAIALTLSVELLVWVVRSSRSLDSRQVVVFKKPKENNALDEVLNLIANNRGISAAEISRRLELPYYRALPLTREAKKLLNGSLP